MGLMLHAADVQAMLLGKRNKELSLFEESRRKIPYPDLEMSEYHKLRADVIQEIICRIQEAIDSFMNGMETRK